MRHVVRSQDEPSSPLRAFIERADSAVAEKCVTLAVKDAPAVKRLSKPKILFGVGGLQCWCRTCSWW